MTYKSDSIKKPVPLRMTDELKFQMQDKAKSEDRSLNNTIEMACKLYLRVANKK